MNVENSVFPTSDQIVAMFQSPEDGAFVMLNLLKFKPKATYESGEDISGREAYGRYGVAVQKLVEKLGGRILYSGNIARLMVGEAEELWDAVALVEYPSRAQFAAMVGSPEYHAIEHHRLAGLAGQLNIETKPRA
jgi:uncharacterized protein (DUF1330 family)